MNQYLNGFRERFLRNPIGDITGGITAAVVALPLCLALGAASGLGAQAGLYGAVACGILAAVFGGTPGQCSGPTGPMTVVAAALYSSNPTEPGLVFAAVFLAGVIQIALGYARAGQLISYMPYPVVSGFMTGIGVIIIGIELPVLFGAPSSGNLLAAIQSLSKISEHFNYSALLIGLACLALIYLLPFISRRLPASLVALVLATWVTEFMKLKVPLIGEIPSGLPVPQVPSIGLGNLHQVLQNGITLALLGSIDSLLTSLVLDKTTGSKHDSDKELVGQGIGNMTAGLLGGLPGAGATMRSMVNVKSGGSSYLSGAIHGLVLLAVLVYLGKIASLIPLSCLAAILFTVGLGIMDWHVLRKLRQTPKTDLLVMLLVLGLTVFVDLIVAVLAGVALASFLFVKQLADAQVSSIGSLESLEELNELSEKIPEAIRERTFIYSLNSPLFFGEARNLSASIDTLKDAKYIILRFANVPLIDQTGVYALENAIERWEAKGIRVLLVGIPTPIRQVIENAGSMSTLGENCFDEFEQALAAISHFESQLNG